MKSLLFLAIPLLSSVLLTVHSFAQKIPLMDDKYGEEIRQVIAFQTEMNRKFSDPERSPLVKDSIPKFKTLNFFTVDNTYIVRASYKEVKNGREFDMKTTTDRKPKYRTFAKLEFEMDGIKHKLTAFQNVEFAKCPEYDSTLFIPFNDHTNGLESYGGGRYIDLPIPKTDSINLNFHLAYNPYCAYNDKYSCPIPPEENKLEVKIRAGVKKYH